MLLSLFTFFFTLGCVSFGGGYAMMSFILQKGQEAVGLTAQEFADMTALELMASGPIAINAATYVGFIKAGIGGAVVATIGVCLPSFILTTILYAFLQHFKENAYVNGFISTVKIACGGVMLTTALTLAQNILILSGDIQYASVQNIKWMSVLIVVVCVVALVKYKVNPIAVILGAAVVGAILF